MFRYQNVFKLTPSVEKVQRRHLFAFLNFMFNRVSKSRIKEVGADRACAEWLMKNGAHVRWKGQSEFVLHYNNLPLDSSATGSYNISHVKAHNASINSVGFPYFVGCKDIVSMEFFKCAFFDDKCINLLSAVKDSLLDLSITSCYEVTDKGLQEILKLHKLNKLVLGDLPGIKYMKLFQRDLQASMPKCKLELQLPLQPVEVPPPKALERPPVAASPEGPPISPSEGAPIKPPEGTPMKHSESPGVKPPEAPPITPPESPPLGSPEGTPIPPETPTVKPEAPPIAPQEGPQPSQPADSKK